MVDEPMRGQGKPHLEVLSTAVVEGGGELNSRPIEAGGARRASGPSSRAKDGIASKDTGSDWGGGCDPSRQLDRAWSRALG